MQDKPSPQIVLGHRDFRLQVGDWPLYISVSRHGQPSPNLLHQSLITSKAFDRNLHCALDDGVSMHPGARFALEMHSADGDDQPNF